MYLNTATILGNLTRDPELKVLPSGQNICTLSLATNSVFTDKDGKKQESVEYHDIVLFGKQAENTAKYLTKGDQACVIGRIQTRSWDKDGTKLYRTEIIGEKIQFGAKKSTVTSEPTISTPKPVTDYPEEEINPEDIPF